MNYESYNDLVYRVDEVKRGSSIEQKTIEQVFAVLLSKRFIKSSGNWFKYGKKGCAINFTVNMTVKDRESLIAITSHKVDKEGKKIDEKLLLFYPHEYLKHRDWQVRINTLSDIFNGE